MQQWIKKLIPGKSAKVTNASTASDYNHVRSSGHDVLVKKMNRYFDNHPVEADKYRKEMDFINQTFKTLSTQEERELYSIYPYPFLFNYNPANAEVYFDEQAQLFYGLLNGKKLYFHKGFNKREDVQKAFTYLVAEQDKESPHRYLNESFSVNTNDIVADIGAAEGNFSLSIVDRVKQIFLFEPNPIWIDALQKTFEPWKHKVHIINKYVGDKNDDRTVTLNEFFEQTGLTIIKMDIEGAEISVLNNSATFLQNRDIKMAVTTYHRNTDAADIKKILEANGYTTRFSKNYMLFVIDSQSPPYFRNALIMASKATK
jgi:hypothetical protein